MSVEKFARQEKYHDKINSMRRTDANCINGIVYSYLMDVGATTSIN
jgi:hypothetical protein